MFMKLFPIKPLSPASRNLESLARNKYQDLMKNARNRITICGLMIAGIGCGSGDQDNSIKARSIDLLSPSEYYEMRSDEGVKREVIGAELRDFALRNLIEKCLVAGTIEEIDSKAFGNFALAETIDASVFKDVFRQFFDSCLRNKDFRKLGFALSYIDERHPDWQWIGENEYIQILESNEFSRLAMIRSGTGVFPLFVSMSKVQRWNNRQKVAELVDGYIALAKTYDEDSLKIAETLESVKERLK